MKKVFHLPAGKVESDEDILKQLDIQEDNRWDVAIVALLAAGVIFAIACAIVLGLSYHHWKHLVE